MCCIVLQLYLSLSAAPVWKANDMVGRNTWYLIDLLFKCFFFISENKTVLCLGSKLSGELERPQLTWNNFVLDNYVQCTCTMYSIPMNIHMYSCTWITNLLSLLFMYSAKKSLNSPKCCLKIKKKWVAFKTESVTETYRILLILLHSVTFGSLMLHCLY